MSDDVWVLGCDMIRFGRYPDKDVADLASESAVSALEDAQITMNDVGVLAVGCLGASAAQRVQKQIGQTGIPAYNVTNACATGATAVRVAYTEIRAGLTDIGLAIGVEQMGKAGLLGVRPSDGGKHVFKPSGRDGSVMNREGIMGTFLMPGTFAHAGVEYARKHNLDISFEQWAKIAEKNHRNSTLNPKAQYQKAFSLDEVMNAEMMAYPNTVLMCSPTGDGSAAVVLVSEERLKKMSPDQKRRAVKVSASVLTSDPWTETDDAVADVNALTRLAADKAYEMAGVGPEDLDLVELHDCFSTAELIHYDNLRLCEEGGALDFLESGGPYRDGKTPVNCSGGLVSKGHPIGATGAAGVYEIATQLRGEAGKRQIPDAKVGMAHVIGLGSSCGLHILEKSAL